VARDYLRAIKRLARTNERLTVVVMDDPHLIEAIALNRASFNCDLKLIFSFHGFRLKLKPEVVNNIDRVLYLSEAGRIESEKKYNPYKPQSIVVWNGVNSKDFFPLLSSEREILRNKLGVKEHEKVLLWMANDRPLKGFHIFKSIVEVILSKYDNIHVVTIGTNNTISHPSVSNLGRLKHSDIASYLQLTDFYFFTTLYEEGFGLSMVEALKCGAVVLASNKGAIPSVLKDQSRTLLIDRPDEVGQWLEAIEIAMNRSWGSLPKTEADKIWNYQNWESRFLSALQFNGLTESDR